MVTLQNRFQPQSNVEGEVFFAQTITARPVVPAAVTGINDHRWKRTGEAQGRVFADVLGIGGDDWHKAAKQNEKSRR